MSGRKTYMWNPSMLARCCGESWSWSFLLEESLHLSKRIAFDSKFDFDKVKDAFDRLNTGHPRGKAVTNIT